MRLEELRSRVAPLQWLLAAGASVLVVPEDVVRGHDVESTWAVVLAGGSGRRLAPLTTGLYGHAIPKQFAVLCGHRSLLQQTVKRLEPIVPEDRIVVVVPREHDGLARVQLAGFPALHVLTQPEDRGTGPGLLLPLAWIRQRDPGALVIESPSDHFVPNVRPFLDGMLVALEGTRGCRLECASFGVERLGHTRARIRQPRGDAQLARPRKATRSQVGRAPRRTRPLTMNHVGERDHIKVITGCRGAGRDAAEESGF
jgi:hypothetical protein